MNAPFVAPALTVGPLRDADKADAYVATHPRATPFHLSGWTASIAAGCGQAGRTLVGERGGAVCGVLPLTLVASPMFGRALVSAGFAVDGGVLADDAATAHALTDAAWRIALDEGAAGLELRGGDAPEGFATDNTTYLGFTRPLAPDDAAELLAIPRKQRAEVRKALASDLVIEIGREPRDLAAHWAVYSESVRNLGTPVFPRALFAAVIERTDADILTVRHRGTPVASVLSLYLGGTVYPYWGGGTAAARGLRANDAMYFALMRHARERGCGRFDFGRSKTGTGPAAFKKNWGFDGLPLTYHKRRVDGAAERSVNPLDPKYARKVELWKRLPLPVANLVGPWISRGLG